MRPLSIRSPKAIIPFLGTPLILHLVRNLRAAGIEDLVLTSRNRRIRELLGDGSSHGVRIRYIQHSGWPGTAGAVSQVADEMPEILSNPVLVIYGDSLLNMDFAGVVEAHRASGADATLVSHQPSFADFLYEPQEAAKPYETPRTNFGVMDIERCRSVTRFVEKPALDQIEREFNDPRANAAVYVLEPTVIENLTSTGEPLDFGSHVFPQLLREGVDVSHFPIERPGYRLDLGTLRMFHAAHMAALDGRLDASCDFPRFGEADWRGEDCTIADDAELQSPIVLGDAVTIASGAAVRRSVLCSDVVIDEGVSVSDSIVLPGSRIGAGVVLSESIIGSRCIVTPPTHLPRGTVLGENHMVGKTELAMSIAAFDRLL